MKNQKNLISILIVLIVILGAVYFTIKNKQLEKPVGEVSAPDNSTVTPITPEVVVPVVKLNAWDTFQQYLVYIKNYDTEKEKTLVSDNVLAFNPTCPMRPVDPKASCNTLMDMAYVGGIGFKKASFVNSWEDAKQIVLSTNPVQEKTDKPNEENYRKEYVFFTKSKDGSPQFLTSYSIVTSFVYKDLAKATPEEKAKRVTAAFVDADKDGLLDKYENCANKNAGIYNNKCSTTDQAKRDSLGDGWWDGVRVFFGHN